MCKAWARGEEQGLGKVRGQQNKLKAASEKPQNEHYGKEGVDG